MTFLQRKQKLIDRLEESPYIKDGVLHFSPELKGRIDAALEQMQNGQTYTEEEMEKFFDEWLGKEE